MHKTLDNQINELKAFFFSNLELSALILTYFMLYFPICIIMLYPATKLQEWTEYFLQIVCKDDMLLLKEYFLSNG